MTLSMKPRHLKRYQEIARLLVRHGRGDLVRATGIATVLDEESVEPGDREKAADLAADLEAMGPTFVKLGQLMSSRVDLFTPAYIEALTRLQDDVAGFAFDQVEEIVSSELGLPLHRVYATFDRVPLAAASLGQVHRATLLDGSAVVVKVQRPGIRGQVLADMEVLTELADVIDSHTDLGRRYAVGALLEEFRKSLLAELDYRREADNLEAVGAMLAEHERLVVPTPYPNFTTSRVLTMEYVEGTKITDLGAHPGPAFDGSALADDLFAAYLKQVLVEGVFHADPHPGNVLITPAGRLVLLDTGMVARLTPATREKLVKLFLAMADARPDDVSRIARTMGKELRDFDESAFERAVTDIVGQFAGAALADMEIGAMLLRLTRDAGDAGLRMDAELVMLGKTLLNLDHVAATLDPGFEPRDAVRRHTTDLMKSSMETSPARLMASLLEAKELVEALPGRVNRALDAIGTGSFEIKVNAFDEDEFLRGLHKLANVLATALILASMILASALLARSGDVPTAENRIALVVFVVSIVVAFAMLARITLQSRKVRAHKRD